ncbi:uncharacterized protein [Montipora capricornis]|uniref:uncharacterized protein n=1 Tax=Montipora capricornis TaxID=246305 RepID=UPI0035F1A91B
MYRNKCAKCEKTRSKTRFLSWEGKSICRKCYHATRNSSLHSNANLNAAAQGESVEGDTSAENELRVAPPPSLDKDFLQVTGEKFAQEIRRLQDALQAHCGKDKNTPIYEPNEFFMFCSQAGATNVFNFILSCMTSSRHSEERNLLNRKRTVVILYQLCFGYSQKCNFFQEDNGLFLKFCNLSQPGIETQRQLGTSVSSRTITRNRAAMAKENFNLCNNAIQEAINKKCAIWLMIDDYHNIHTIRRPQDASATCQVDHMCTIIIKIVKEAPAIEFNSVNLIHNPNGIDVDLLINQLCSVQFLSQVCNFTSSSSMPEFTSYSFDPVMGRQQMESHVYQDVHSFSAVFQGCLFN